MAANLGTMNVKELREIAAAQGVSPDDIETARDGDNPKQDLIALIKSLGGGSAAADLDSMSVKELREIAAAQGVSPDDIETARDGDNPKQDLIALIRPPPRLLPVVATQAPVVAAQAPVVAQAVTKAEYAPPLPQGQMAPTATAPAAAPDQMAMMQMQMQQQQLVHQQQMEREAQKDRQDRADRLAAQERADRLASLERTHGTTAQSQQSQHGTTAQAVQSQHGTTAQAMQPQIAMMPQTTVMTVGGRAPTKYCGVMTHLIGMFIPLMCLCPVDELPAGYEAYHGPITWICCLFTGYWPALICPCDTRPLPQQQQIVINAGAPQVQYMTTHPTVEFER